MNKQSCFICIGCDHELPNSYCLNTTGYCYLCDPNITVTELLEGFKLDIPSTNLASP